MDATIAANIEALAREMLGDTPAKRIGLAPKRMLIYRTAEPFNGRKRKPLELLARGQQFVAYAIHPVTGQPYQWPEESLAEIDIGSLPVVTEAQALAWLDKAYAMVPPELRPVSLFGASVAGRAPDSHNDPRGTPEAVRDALRWLPNDDLDGASWIMMCNAIKGALGEAGREIWVDWSRSSSKSGASGKTDTAEKRWKSARPRSIGAGTIYHLAQERGWTPPAEVALNPDKAAIRDEPIHPAAGLIAKALARATAQQADKSVAADTMRLTGALDQLVDFTVRTAFSPQPFLALGAALSAVGAFAGRRYASPTGLRTNVFSVGLADSSSGKDQARKCIKRLCQAAGLMHYLGGEEIASSQAIYASLEQFPARLFLLNEFGQMVAGMTGRQAASHRVGILPTFTKLFTSAGEPVLGTEYASQSGKDSKRRVDLHSPHLCVYGDTVASVLWGAMRNGALSDGSVARFLVFQTDNDAPDYQHDLAPMDVPASLVELVKAITDGAEDHGGNLAVAMSATRDLTPYTVPYGAGVKEALRELADEQLAWKRENIGTPAAAFIGRYWEHAVRCAMIRAISYDPGRPAIGLSDVEWAKGLVSHCLSTAMREADANVADSKAESDAKQLLAVVRKAGEIRGTDLQKATRWLSRRDRAQILDDLCETGELFRRTVTGEGRPATYYTATPGKSYDRMSGRGEEE